MEQHTLNSPTLFVFLHVTCSAIFRLKWRLKLGPLAIRTYMGNPIKTTLRPYKYVLRVYVRATSFRRTWNLDGVKCLQLPIELDFISTVSIGWGHFLGPAMDKMGQKIQFRAWKIKYPEKSSVKQILWSCCIIYYIFLYFISGLICSNIGCPWSP